MFNDKVKALLDEKINEIFLMFQTDMDIKSGDVEPLDYFEMEEKINELSDVMARALAKQASQNERVFYDFERDAFFTESELKKDYDEMISDGTLESDIYSCFGYYLNACMDYNDGSLEEIR